MTNIEFEKLTLDEKLQYAKEHPTEVYFQITEKGYEYLKSLENNTLEEQNK